MPWTIPKVCRDLERNPISVGFFHPEKNKKTPEVLRSSCSSEFFSSVGGFPAAPSKPDPKGRDPESQTRRPPSSEMLLALLHTSLESRGSIQMENSRIPESRAH